LLRDRVDPRMAHGLPALRLDGLGELREPLRVAHRYLGQHLAIEQDPGLLQRGHEPRVREPGLAARGVDANDPEAARQALLLLAPAIGEGARAEDGLGGRAIELASSAEVALRLPEDLLAPAARLRSTLCPWHACRPSRSEIGHEHLETALVHCVDQLGLAETPAARRPLLRELVLLPPAGAPELPGGRAFEALRCPALGLHLRHSVRRPCLSLKSKSAFSVFGPILTSLTRIVVCFLRASFSRRACVYLYLPKSMMRHTGGCASGATSTRSSSCCRAVSSACWMAMTPSCAPSAPTTRTSRTRIPSLIRISFAWLIDALLVVSRRIRRAGQGGPAARSRTAHGETGRARADLAREVREHTVEGDGPEVLPAPVPEADGPVLALPLADDEHVRDLPDLRLADPVAELLIAVVELRPHARGAELLPDGPPVRGV